jgi:probable F420-dependent oxidoreductase
MPSPRPFRFALQSMPTDRTTWQDLARKAEDLGFSTLQVADHLGAADPFSPLVSAADVTTTLRVGTLVLNNELHHPVLLARQAATVDLLSDGRLELGLGTGYALGEHTAMNIPLSPPPLRVRRLGAAVRLVQALMAGKTADDEIYGVQGAALGFAAVQHPHPPILVGGHGDAVLRMAAEQAQIVQLTGLVHDADGTPRPGGFGVETIEGRVAWVRQAAGGRFANLELSALVQRTVIGAAAREEATELADRWGMEPADLAASPFLLLGSVETIVEKLLGLRDRLGISYFTVREADAFAPVIERLAGQ